MIVYNLSIKITSAIHNEWVQWQKQEHIPEVMASKQFIEYKFYRLLGQDESDGITYIVQYFALTMDHYNKYIENFAPALRQKSLDKWGDQFIAFRTIMQVVD